MDKRTPRTTETREDTSRKKSWVPPSVLPVPDDRDGWVHRWIRTGARGSIDNVNVSSKPAGLGARKVGRVSGNHGSS